MAIAWHNPFKYLLGWGGDFCIKDCFRELLTRVFRITANMPIRWSSATLSYIRSRIGSVFIVITIVIVKGLSPGVISKGWVWSSGWLLLLLLLLLLLSFFFLPLLSLLFIIIIIYYYYYYYYYYYFNLTSYIGREWLTNDKNVVKVSRVTFIKSHRFQNLKQGLHL